MAAKLSTLGSDRFQLTQHSDINVTPFVDIMLVLLIIFMVAIPATVTAVKVDLPPETTGTPPKLPTYVSVQKDGALFIGDRATSLASLPSDLGATIGRTDDSRQATGWRAS